MAATCRTCSGSGVVEIGERMIECECALVRRMAASMPAYVRRADVRKEHLDLPIMGMTRRNALVVASWQDMKAVVKAVIIANQRMFIKVTSDREIRDVYVGSKSRAARGDDEGQIYNSLEDLMDPPALMVVRMNELSYKNKAAPGALEEAICYRMDREKPTWLFSDLDKPFSLGSHAWSESVAEVIRSNFVTVRLARILPPASFDQEAESVGLTGVTSAQSRDTPTAEPATAAESIPEPERVEPVRPKKVIRPSEDDEGPLARYGAGLSKKPSSKGSSFGRGR